MSQNIVDETHSLIANALRKFLVKNEHMNYVDRHIFNEFEKCKNFLRANDDVFAKADKDQLTTMMPDSQTDQHTYSMWRGKM